AELADALDLGSSGRKVVRVQIPPRPPVRAAGRSGGRPRSGPWRSGVRVANLDGDVCGNSSVVERLLAKEEVTGSNPVSRLLGVQAFGPSGVQAGTPNRRLLKARTPERLNKRE